MQIWISGAAGKLGSDLMQTLSAHEIIGTDLAEVDIADFAAVQAFINEHRPDMVLNASAWTDVDGCAQEPEKAIRINGYGAQNLAVAAYEVGAAMVQISSNEVFDGTSSRSYYEYDRPNPANPYGYSKFVGEQSVRETNPRHYIVRTSWLFASGGRNFLHAILGAAKEGKNLRVVVDEIANPTYNTDLAQAIAQLVQTERYGTYHLVNEGAVSRWGFARYALDKAGYAQVPLGKITRHEWPRPSTPPPYTSLANLAAASIGIRLRPWQEAVDAFLQEADL
ncbi:MAG: dTDP-4-dehydrorhamnose reductase [Anaerolineae bacterium]|nr:dTDP-4-dehydrorhamnose reductase [Anaerolineae bacterium]